MNGSTKQKIVFYGNKTKNFRPVELQGAMTCFCCGERRGPFAIRKKPSRDPVFDFEEEDQLGKDANLYRALLFGGFEAENAPIEWVCAPCIARHDLKICD